MNWVLKNISNELKLVVALQIRLVINEAAFNVLDVFFRLFICSHVTEAAKKQLDKLWHTTNIYYHPTIHEYAEMMASKLPGNLKVISAVKTVPIPKLTNFPKLQLN